MIDIYSLSVAMSRYDSDTLESQRGYSVFLTTLLQQSYIQHFFFYLLFMCLLIGGSAGSIESDSDSIDSDTIAIERFQFE